MSELDALRRYVDGVIDALTQEMHAQFQNEHWKRQVDLELFQQELMTRFELWIAHRDQRWRNDAIFARQQMMYYAGWTSALVSASLAALAALWIFWRG